MISRSHPKISEFGDFQTPAAVTRTICRLLAERGSAPASVIEPTCGIGNFLLSALNEFSSVQRALGIEINQTYADKVSAAVRARPDSNKVQIVRDSFFSTNVGDDTKIIRHLAPKTWKYLEEHSELLDGRASSIYRNRPRFSVFGVGEYSFSPWKVAISGFYSNLHFAAIGDGGGKPMVFDDTCYFVACHNEEEAKFVASLLNSPVTREFFSAFIFWDVKRPVTTDVLQRLNLLALAREIGEGDRMSGHWEKRNSETSSGQRDLFE